VKKAPAANAAGKSTLARTIQLLVRKGVITETEASILLDDNVL
jgi:ABC-type branched-subunit amino acid transport system ATPase component